MSNKNEKVGCGIMVGLLSFGVAASCAYQGLTRGGSVISVLAVAAGIGILFAAILYYCAVDSSSGPSRNPPGLRDDGWRDHGDGGGDF